MQLYLGFVAESGSWISKSKEPFAFVRTVLSITSGFARSADVSVAVPEGAITTVTNFLPAFAAFPSMESVFTAVSYSALIVAVPSANTAGTCTTTSAMTIIAVKKFLNILVFNDYSSFCRFPLCRAQKITTF